MITKKVQKGFATLFFLAATHMTVNLLYPKNNDPNDRRQLSSNNPNSHNNDLQNIQNPNSLSGLTQDLSHIDPHSKQYLRILFRRQRRYEEGKKLAETKILRRQTLRKLNKGNNNLKNIHFRRDKRLENRLVRGEEERQLELGRELGMDLGQSIEVSSRDATPLTVCGRTANVGASEDFALLQQYANCEANEESKTILLLEGVQTYGRTGNNLVEFLHALQYARDHKYRLYIVKGSWAMNLISKMWMAIQDEDGVDWETKFEEAFCVKILRPKEVEELEKSEALHGYTILRKDTKELFLYSSEKPLNEYMESQEYSIRTLFHSYNIGGKGVFVRGQKSKDMCSGIDALFGEQIGGGGGGGPSTAIYSVIHSRHLEGPPGIRLLSRISLHSGCDPVGALEMRPDYVKSILRPLNMLHYPIVLITDGQDFSVIQRLLTDPEIGPQIKLVPDEASWIGGDMTLAIMSDVFIGNPASTFSGFIAKSRLALGLGHNYLFRAKDEEGRWRTSCGESCIFDKNVMNAMM